MKKFYLHDGNIPRGPYDLEDLKCKNLTRETPVWYEGLEGWIMACKIPELREVLNPLHPPPFTAKLNNLPSEKKGLSIAGIIISIGVILITLLLTVMVINNITSSMVTHVALKPGTYRQNMMTIEETERSQPDRFLKAQGVHNRNIWGNKLKVHGTIQNKATIVSYKEVVLKVTFYDKNKSLLGSKEFIINDSFPPRTEVKFDLKIESDLPAAELKFAVVKAKTY